MFEAIYRENKQCRDQEHGMLKAFRKGKKVPCSKIFKMTPTDIGMCCALNLEKVDEMFQDGVFKRAFTFYQKRKGQNHGF